MTRPEYLRMKDATLVSHTANKATAPGQGHCGYQASWSTRKTEWHVFTMSRPTCVDCRHAVRKPGRSAARLKAITQWLRAQARTTR